MPAVTAKKKCCKDKPRCKKCPVVLKRLELLGYAECQGQRSYVVDKNIPKKSMSGVRQR